MSTMITPNGNGTFDVITVCHGDCGRRIEQSNIPADNATEAGVIAHTRLQPEGWSRGECGQCALHSSGWQADPLNYRQTGGRT